jgi:hypothetical protein
MPSRKTARARFLVAGVLPAFIASCSGTPSGPGASARPSILLVTVDTLRADHVGCLRGRRGADRNLDRLGRDGIRFEEARSHVPLTAPSHATILTGLLPPRHGVRGNGPFRLRPEASTLAEALRRAGYHTGAVVAVGGPGPGDRPRPRLRPLRRQSAAGAEVRVPLPPSAGPRRSRRRAAAPSRTLEPPFFSLGALLRPARALGGAAAAPATTRKSPLSIARLGAWSRPRGHARARN